MPKQKTNEGAGDLSLRGYAEHRKRRGLRGHSLGSVQKAIKSGRIFRRCPEHEECPLECRQGKIDPVRADLDWENNTDPAAIRGTGLPATPEDGTTSPAFQEARTDRIVWESRLARLKYEERLGQLVSADEVRVRIFRKARQVRDTLLALPRRVAPRLARETDRRVIQAFLEKELRRALDAIAVERIEDPKR